MLTTLRRESQSPSFGVPLLALTASFWFPRAKDFELFPSLLGSDTQSWRKEAAHPRGRCGPSAAAFGAQNRQTQRSRSESLPSHRLTWKCTDPCRKTTVFLERAFLQFHVSWWEGKRLLSEAEAGYGQVGPKHGDARGGNPQATNAESSSQLTTPPARVDARETL